MQPIKKEKIKKSSYTQLPNIAGKVKKFDQSLHDKYDIDARHILKIYLKDDIKDNENKYGEDMIFTLDPFPYKYLEVQVLSVWDSDVFPYLYPFVYSRKMKFSDKTLFITFNKYYSELIIFSKACISKIPSRIKKYDREFVHYVSWGNALKIKTTSLNTRAIREYSGEFIND